MKRQLLKLYSGLGFVSIFAYFRLCHAPYELAERFVPNEGFIADLGCGYGFFTNYLAMRSKERYVLGIDRNTDKLDYGQRQVGNTHFLRADITTYDIEGKWDAFILFHVLHHLKSYDDQYELIRKAYLGLKYGAKLIVVEIDRRPLWKFWFTCLVDNALYFGDKFYFRSDKDWKALFRTIGFINVQSIRADRFVPLSHRIYVCTK